MRRLVRVTRNGHLYVFGLRHHHGMFGVEALAVATVCYAFRHRQLARSLSILGVVAMIDDASDFPWIQDNETGRTMLMRALGRR